MQEHWLILCEFGQFQSLGMDVIYSAVPLMETHLLHMGRPFSGVVLLWHKRMQRWTSPLDTGSSRLAAVGLSFGTRKMPLV